MYQTRPGRGFSRWLLGAAAIVFVAGCGLGGRGAPADPPLPPQETDPPVEAASVGVSEGYSMGPEDLLNVRVFGAPDLSGEVRVTSDGEVSMPLLGRIRAAGLTPRELEESIEAELRGSYMWDPRVSVQILEARSHVVSRIYVLGNVQQPGGYPLERGEPVSVIQAVALAEGLAPAAAAGRARIIREGPDGAQEEIEVDLGRILDGEANDPLLHHQDVLFVPNSTPKTAARAVWNTFVSIFTLRGFLR